MSADKLCLTLVLCVVLVKLTGAYIPRGPRVGPAEVMYEWVFVDYDWPSDEVKRQYQQDGRYDPTHNLIISVRTYRDEVYVTVPRLRYTTGVPSTLNKLVKKGNQTVLSPYPNWESNELGNCSALQCVVSMEIDPIRGYMYVIDTGRSGILGNLTNQPPPTICPPKLVVYDLKDGRLVRSHIFPEDVASRATNFLDDIVLDRGNAQSTMVKWVHITDFGDAKLITFDLMTNKSHAIHHPSMNGDPGSGSDITVNGVKYKLVVPINGIAMSADFRYVYYCALGSKDLYQIPTRVLRYPGQDFAGNVRLVGSKVSQSDGIVYATDNLYYGALTRNAVYRWEVSKDERAQGVGEGQVKLKTEREVAQDDEKMVWPESLTVDEKGYLWFTACKIQQFIFGDLDFTGAQGVNYRIWRVNISEKGYQATPNSLSD